MTSECSTSTTIILGISAFYHDSAAALIIDGRVVAAVQEERFSRIKNDDSFPNQSIQWILQSQSLSPQQIDYVVFYEKPFVRFERLLETYFAYAPKGFASFCRSMPRWIKDKLFQKGKILNQLKQLDANLDWTSKLLFSDHHLSHAASAFYPSPFQQAAILTLDGVGEWSTTTVAVGDGASIRVLSEMRFPHSIGLLYSTLTAFLGFKVNSGEYKVMGLAPYGEPVFTGPMLEHLLDLKEDGSFRLNMDYFSFATDVQMASPKMQQLFGISPREPESPLLQVHMNIAASLQQLTEVILLKLAKHVANSTGAKQLCLAGGVALNCVANEKLRQTGWFEEIWVQPAAGDAGGAVGAALAVYHLMLEQPRTVQPLYSTYLGPVYTEVEVERALLDAGAVFEVKTMDTLIDEVPQLLAAGKIVGWMQGAAEFGPRALGNRSILADPRVADLQSSLNLKIKFRESFRPFAPSILAEKTAEWFDSQGPSTYMGFVATAKAGVRLQVPAVVHLDETARLQTVTEQDNPLFHRLLSRFAQLTDCPLLVNTSFNVRGEPMVLSPRHAFDCFMGTGIDVLVIGQHILYKAAQHQQQATAHVLQFVPD